MATTIFLVQQFKSLRFKEFKGTVIDKDPPSHPMDKDRHLIDSVSYIHLDDRGSSTRAEACARSSRFTRSWPIDWDAGPARPLLNRDSYLRCVLDGARLPSRPRFRSSRPTMKPEFPFRGLSYGG